MKELIILAIIGMFIVTLFVGTYMVFIKIYLNRMEITKKRDVVDFIISIIVFTIALFVLMVLSSLL